MPLFTHYSVISSTSPSPPHYLYLTFFTLPSTASSSDSFSLDQPPPPQQSCPPLQPPQPNQPLSAPSIFQPGSLSLLSSLHLAIPTSPYPPCSLDLVIFTLLSTLNNIPDFVLQPPKSGVNTVRLEQVWTCCFSRQAHGQLWPASSSVFEAQNLPNSEKSSGFVWKICAQEVPWVIKLSLGAAPLGKVWLPLGPP